MNKVFFKYYLKQRPLFMSLFRTKEAELFGKHATFKGKTLDFGCGDGFFTQALKINYPKLFKEVNLTGVDISTKALESATDLMAAKQKIYQQLVHYKGTYLPFKDCSFNTVYSNCVLEHLPFLSKNLEEIYRVLKPGGYLYVTVMTNKWEDFLFLPKLFWKKMQSHNNLYSITTWNDIFNKTGFTITHKAGYINQKQAQLIELYHFLSLPYLISKILFGSWNTFSSLYVKNYGSNKELAKIFNQNSPSGKSAAAYYSLIKK